MCLESPFPRRLGDPLKFGGATSSVLEKPRRRHLANKHGCDAHGCSREYHYLVVAPPNFGGLFGHTSVPQTGPYYALAKFEQAKVKCSNLFIRIILILFPQHACPTFPTGTVLSMFLSEHSTAFRPSNSTRKDDSLFFSNVIHRSYSGNRLFLSFVSPQERSVRHFNNLITRLLLPLYNRHPRLHPPVDFCPRLTILLP